MNCNDYNDSIMRYFDNSLNDIESAQLKQHLKVCKKCSCEFEDMSVIFSSLENGYQVEPPEDFELKVMEKIRTIQPGWKEVPDGTIKFIYGFTSFLLVLLLFMFALNMAGANIIESFTSRFTALNSIFDIMISIRDFVLAIFSFIGDLTFTFVRITLLIAKTYYYIIILVSVILFAIQWMYVSFLRQFQGGHTR
jgi:hypothetical protein